MEPRGIEPRSRDSQSGASTRVPGGLISAFAAITRSLRKGPTCSIFSRFHPCRSQMSASSKSVVVMLSSIARGPRSLIRPRERSYARQTLWCMLFTRLACSWTRSNQTSHARSNPVRPRVEKDRESIGRRSCNAQRTNAIPQNSPSSALQTVKVGASAPLLANPASRSPLPLGIISHASARSNYRHSL